MALEAEIAVVGAGVNGLATAYELARTGHDVVVHEQFEFGHARGSSHGRSRIVRLAYPEAHWVRLAREALDGWRELEAAAGERLLVLSGLLELVRDPATSSQAALEECGIACEVLDAEAVERRFGVAVPAGVTVLFQPEAGIVFADRALHAFARGVRQYGGRLVEHSRIESLDEVDAGAVVVTAGPWARGLLAAAGIELPVVESAETVAYFRLEGEILSVVAEIANGHGFYALADPLHGLKVGRHRTGRPADADEVHTPDAEIVREISEWTAQRFTLADPTPAGAETCFYTSTADERFVLERHGRIVVGSACSGHGFKFAPAVGKRLAALAIEAAG